MKIDKNNYQYYKGIYKCLWEFHCYISGIDPSIKFSPINKLAEFENQDFELSKKSLKIGLTNICTMISHLSKEQRTELNKRLGLKEYLNFEILFSKIKNTPNKVITRNKIKSINEYYIIKEVLDDIEYNISEENRTILNRIFNEFEVKNSSQ